MHEIIKDFFKQVASKNIEIYNEFSLQHELGIYIRNHMKNEKVQFERNVQYFNFDKANFIKKEIDIVIFQSQNNLDIVLELKYPRNGEIPENFFKFCKDIKFLEQLTKNGFRKGYFLAVADHQGFYEGNNNGIYGLFRNNELITGEIIKPTAKKDQVINLSGKYRATWKLVKGSTKYCLIEINS